MKRTLIFLMALFMAGITTYLFFNYTKGITPRAKTVAMETVPAVIAKQAIKKDTKITSQMVVVEEVPKDSLQPDAVTSIDKVTGRFALIDIQPNEMILSHHLIKADESQYLSYKIKADFRAVTVTAEVLAENVANLIEPGDTVDVVFSSKGKATYLFKNIRVLAVDQRMKESTGDAPDKPYTMTTLELNPEGARIIVETEQKIEADPSHNKLALVLHSKSKSSKEE